MSCACTTTLSSCGCCEGVTAETPQTTLNRAGLSAIAYRVAAYPQFYETLLARIAQSGQPSLRALKSREPDDFTIALLDAFSVMGDVLTFYTERYGNESYLRTATQRQSVRELANLVGYRMSPGVAASVYLAFTIDPTAGAYGTVLTAPVNAQVMPELVPSIIIPVGTQVQSIPGPGQTPQTFETIAQIFARAEWNAITPVLTQPQTITAATTALLLSGSSSNLKKGDPILLVSAGPVPITPITSVQNVTVSADGKTTEIDLPSWVAPAPFAPLAFQPNSFTDGVPATATNDGTLPKLQAAPDMATAASMLAAQNYYWDAGDIVAAATANQWPLDQLAALVNQQVAAVASAQATATNLPRGGAYVFRQQAAPFGYNAPNYYSLPATMLNPTIVTVEQLSPPASPLTTMSTAMPAAYPTPWDPALEPPSGSGFTLNQWGGSLYLDSTYTQVVPNSYILLINTTNGSQSVYQVATNTTVTYSNFAMSGKVSLLTLVGNPDLSSFGLRTTAILCQSEALPLAPVPITTPILTNPTGTSTPNTITLGGAFLGLLAGQQIILSGTTLSTQGGTTLAGPVAAEQAVLEDVQLSGGYTVVTLATPTNLASPLQNTYQRATVAINANVASATNGQSVQETLGSGDGTQTFQSFILHQAPLTYILADTESGTASTLLVRVDGILWSEVPFLYGHGPGEQIFITSQDDSGVTTVMFGDGITGSRLPTGTANIVANYRFGIGTAGLVNANQISQLMSRPLGVRGANNPLPSAGAADPEDLDSGRDQATLAIMTLGRVVSLEDFQDFALSYVGIGKALATWTWDGLQRVVVLTVAGVNGALDSTDPILAALQQSIELVSEPGVQLLVVASPPYYFNMNATVQISSDYLIPNVQAAIQAALTASFGFSARTFGQPIFQSEVIAVIQEIPGVVDVMLTLYLSSDPLQQQVTQIAAALPEAGARNQFTAAQLLTLDPGTLGITLQTVTP